MVKYSLEYVTLILGEYRGPSHSHCQLQYKIDPRQWKCPVVFHNLKCYDEHFIINAVKAEHGPMRIVPSNMERFLAFSIDRQLSVCQRIPQQISEDYG